MKIKTLAVATVTAVLILGISISLIIHYGFNFNDNKQVVQTSAHATDAFMLKANYYEYDTQGQLSSHMFSPKVTHQQYMNTTQYENPEVTIYSNKSITWIITADHGKSIHGVKKVLVWGHVKFVQPELTGREPTTTIITTSSATLYPQKSFAETKQRVTITRPNAKITGKGLTADFKTGIFKLLSESRGSYAPPKN
jgi:lipopolysaccharide export system protein LptC